MRKNSKNKNKKSIEILYKPTQTYVSLTQQNDWLNLLLKKDICLGKN